MGVSIKLDTAKLDMLAHEAGARADRACGEVAFTLEGDIKDHFTQSPSAPGEPPGILTGTLKNSIQARKQRDRYWIVAAGTEYAAFLEHGTARMAARPYFRPAAERIARKFAGTFKLVVKV